MKNIGFLSHLDRNLYHFRAPIMKALLKEGYNVYAICPKGDKNKALEDFGVEVINYEINRKSINPLNEVVSIYNIYKALKDLHLDLLHTFTAKPNIYGTFAAKKANIPIVLNLVEGLGSFYVSDTLKNILIRKIMEFLYKKTFKLSNGCVFVNADDPKYMLSHNIINREKIVVIRSVGVDTDKFNISKFSSRKIQTIREKNHLDNKIVVLMVARAIWDKGIREYYEACEIIKQKYSNVEFLLAGDTDEGNHSCASVEFLKNGDVKWLGYRDDIVELTAISDICVLASYREGLPATLMEAASMGKPIVTTDSIGCREVVDDGINGFLVPIKDSNSLADKINILIENEGLRKSMGEKSRQKAIREFDINIVVKKYLQLYENFLFFGEKNNNEEVELPLFC